jgi:hypothetical protein
MWFDCVLDFRFLVSVHACALVLATCMWCLATCVWQWFLALSWSMSLLGSTWAFCFDTWSFSHIPASTRCCIFQLQVHLHFHFQFDFLLPVLVFWQELTSHAQFLARDAMRLARDAMLYYIVFEFSMNSIWIVLTISSRVSTPFLPAETQLKHKKK